MGLCTTPATFQRANQLVLRGLKWKEIIVYLDNAIKFELISRTH